MMSICQEAIQERGTSVRCPEAPRGEGPALTRLGVVLCAFCKGCGSTDTLLIGQTRHFGR